MNFKKILTIVIIICYTSGIRSQSVVLDSLLNGNEIAKDKGKHYELIADENIKLSDYQTALEYYKKSESNYNSERELISLKNKIGRTYFLVSNYEKAIEYLNSAMMLAEKYDDSKNLAQILNNIGIIYQKTGNYDKSIEYLEQALNFKKEFKDSVGIANAYNNLGNVYYNLDLNKSVKYYEKALKIRTKIKDSVGIAVSHNNIGLINFKTGKYSLAIEHFKYSLEIKQKKNDSKSIAITLNNIGETLLYDGKYSEAIIYSRKSLNIALKVDARLQIANSYTTLASCYEYLNDYQSAYKYYKLYKQTSDSIFNLKSKDKIAKLESQYQLSKKEQEIELLTKDNKLNRIINYYTITGLIALLTITIVVIILFFQAKRNSKQRIKLLTEEKKNRQLKNEKNKLLLEKQNLKNYTLNNELNLKKRELTSQAMLLVKNNETILKLLEEINNIKPYSNPEGIKKIESIINDYKISKNDFNWLEFEKHFENVHTEFYKILDSKFKKLTPNERKLCAFLRLNLSTKEIASITFKSYNTIKTSRKRLRKKLQLDPNDNLVSFLINIATFEDK